MKKGLITISFVVTSGLLAFGCSTAFVTSSNPLTPSKSPSNVFEAYLSSSPPPVDGFDFPVGNADARGSYTDIATGAIHNGWFVATKFGEHYSLGIHPAEDWNGAGGNDTDF